MDINQILITCRFSDWHMPAGKQIVGGGTSSGFGRVASKWAQIRNAAVRSSFTSSMRTSVLRDSSQESRVIGQDQRSARTRSFEVCRSTVPQEFKSTEIFDYVSNKKCVDCIGNVREGGNKTCFNSSGGLDKLLGLSDPTLVALGNKVPEVLLRCQANSTNKAYSRVFKLWKSWAANFEEVVVLPANPYHVSLFIIQQSEKTNSASSVKLILPSLKWAHRMAGLTCDLDSQHLKDISGGLRRKLAKPRNPKEVISAENVVKIIGSLDLDSVFQLRTAAMIILSFAGFLRFDDLTNLKFADLFFKESHLELRIRSSKTDQLRQGDVLVIAKTNSVACPYNILSKYVQHFNSYRESESFLFRNITSRGVFRSENRRMAYSNVRAMVLERFFSIGLDIKKYGIHSLRAGGATEAANRGVPDRMFQRHGRWATASIKDLYVKDSLNHRLAVSQNIGI